MGGRGNPPPGGGIKDIPEPGGGIIPGIGGRDIPPPAPGAPACSLS